MLKGCKAMLKDRNVKVMGVTDWLWPYCWAMTYYSQVGPKHTINLDVLKLTVLSLQYSQSMARLAPYHQWKLPKQATELKLLWSEVRLLPINKKWEQILRLPHQYRQNFTITFCTSLSILWLKYIQQKFTAWMNAYEISPTQGQIHISL